MPKLLRIAAGLFALAAGCRPASEPASGPPATINPDPKTADELFEAYKANGDAADKLFRGKRLTIKGEVGGLIDAEKDEPWLQLVVHHPEKTYFANVNGVLCYFPPRAKRTTAEDAALRKRLRKLKADREQYKGRRDEMTVEGTVGGKLGDVLLLDCRIVKYEKVGDG